MVLALPLIALVVVVFALSAPQMSHAMMAPIVAFFKQLFSPIPLMHLVEWLTDKTVALADLFARSMGQQFETGWRPLRDYFAHHGEIAKYNQNSQERTKALLWGYANWNTNVDLPRAIRDTTGPLGARVVALEHAKGKTRPVGVTGQQVAVIARKSATVTIPAKIQHDIAEIEWLRAQHKLIFDITRLHHPVAVGPPVEATQTGTQAIARSKAQADARFRRLEKLLGASGLVGAMSLALGLPLAKMLKCNHFKALKRLPACGPGSVLAGLAGLFADILAFSAICELLPVMEKGLELVEPALVSFTSGAAAKLCSGNYTKPAALVVPALKLKAFTVAPTLHLV